MQLKHKAQFMKIRAELKTEWETEIKCILEICLLTDNDGNGFTAQMVIMFSNYIIIIS